MVTFGNSVRDRGSRGLGWLGLALFVAVGCGSDGLISKGDFCSRLGVSTCDRGVTCGLTTAGERQACLDSFQAGCCETDGSCGERAANEAEQNEVEAVINACLAEMATFDCGQLGAGNAPASCER